MDGHMENLCETIIPATIVLQGIKRTFHIYTKLEMCVCTTLCPPFQLYIALDKQSNHLIFFSFLHEKTYAVGTHKKHLSGAFLMSTHCICLFVEKWEKYLFFGWKKVPYQELCYILVPTKCRTCKISPFFFQKLIRAQLFKALLA